MKRWLWIILIGSQAWAVPTVTPTTATVIMGNQTQFITPDTVTWSLAAGSTGTISATGLYTAPKSFVAKNIIDGVMALPNDHIYNTRIDALPVDTNSAARIANILGGTSAYIQIEPDFPHNVMTNATPNVSLTFLDTPFNSGNFQMLGFPYGGAEHSLIPDDNSRDQHFLGVNTDSNQFSEIYDIFPVGAAAGSGCPLCTSGAGVKYYGTDYNLGDTAGGNQGGATDAAGMFIDPLLIRYSELKAGHINHALRFTLANAYIYSGLLWPAQSFTNECGTIGTCIPYGSRFRLKSSFDITPYSATTQTILRALKEYGMFLTDGGTSMHIQAMTDVVADSITYAAIKSEIANGQIASQWKFEQVDESSLEVSSATGKVNLSNGFVTPDNFAEVVATKNSDSSSTTVRVAIQPFTVGTKNPSFQAKGPMLAVMAGTPQFQIPYWVNGATTTTVSCSMSPTVGSITSTCLYAAPSGSVLASSTTQVTITATIDSTATITFPLTVFSSDGVRMNTGGKALHIISPVIPYDSAGNYGADANGRFWPSDPIGMIPSNSIQDGSFPQGSWPGTTDVGLYYTYYNASNDMGFAVMAPNGNYNLQIGFAADSNNADITKQLQSIDTQGTTVMSTGTFKSLIGTTYYNPVTTTIPVIVSNNQFYFALRDVTASSGTIINNWSLTYIGPLFSNKQFSGSGLIKGNGLIH